MLPINSSRLKLGRRRWISGCHAALVVRRFRDGTGSSSSSISRCEGVREKNDRHERVTRVATAVDLMRSAANGKRKAPTLFTRRDLSRLHAELIDVPFADDPS
jgi:hypothetical protein